MADLSRMCEIIEEEIVKIEERGLNTGNLETAYKLIDMYKDLKTIEGMEGYSQRSSSYGKNGNPYDRYMTSKHSYRGGHSLSAKADMMESLREYMSQMADKLSDMRRDADTQEERDMIDKYINLIRS